MPSVVLCCLGRNYPATHRDLPDRLKVFAATTVSLGFRYTNNTVLKDVLLYRTIIPRRWNPLLPAPADGIYINRTTEKANLLLVEYVGFFF